MLLAIYNIFIRKAGPFFKKIGKNELAEKVAKIYAKDIAGNVALEHLRKKHDQGKVITEKDVKEAEDLFRRIYNAALKEYTKKYLN